MFTSLCACVPCKSACVSICKYVFLFSCLNVHQFLCLWVCVYVCMAVTLLLSLYLQNLFAVIVVWFCNTIFIFINHHPSCFISFFHPSIAWEFAYCFTAGNLLFLSILSYPSRLPVVLTPAFVIWHHLIMMARGQGM